MIHSFRPTKRIEFPNNRGITGVAFKSGQIAMANTMHNQRDYIEDMDNLTNCKDVRNFLIGPVYAHEKDLQVSKHANPINFDRQKPIGMIQLINKINNEKITKHDISKF